MNKKEYYGVSCFLQYLMNSQRETQMGMYYIFTISPHQRYVERLVLEDAVGHLIRTYKSVVSLQYVFETSAKGKLHIHGLIHCKDSSKFIKLRKHPTVKYTIEPYIVDGGWIEYICKDEPQAVYRKYRSRDMHGRLNNHIHDLRILEVTNKVW